MSHHKIELTDIEWPIIMEKELAGSYGGGSNKTLLLRVVMMKNGKSSITFPVQRDQSTIITHDTLPHAIGHYNKLP